MQVFQEPEDFPSIQVPIALTIGNFDSVHLGHRHILQYMQKLCPKTHKCVVTFKNHPSEILRPTLPTPLICTLPHKIKLLEEAGIDSLLPLTFDSDFAKQTAECFIQKIRSAIPFTHLILGHDATLGNNRRGTREAMGALAERLNFKVYYAEEYCPEGEPISSTFVRKLLREGDLKKVEKLLGRPYSIYSTVQRGLGNGKRIGFPTINVPLRNLCLPPYGVYAVTLRYGGVDHPGIANLGLAPTIKSIDFPILETHLFSFSGELYDREVEVIFHRFIRAEQKFSSLNELKVQIRRDVELAIPEKAKSLNLLH